MNVEHSRNIITAANLTQRVCPPGTYLVFDLSESAYYYLNGSGRSFVGLGSWSIESLIASLLAVLDDVN